MKLPFLLPFPGPTWRYTWNHTEFEAKKGKIPKN